MLPLSISSMRVGDEKGAGQFVCYHDECHAKRALEFQNQLVDACGDDGVESCGGVRRKKRISGSMARARATAARFLLHAAAELRRHVVFKSLKPQPCCSFSRNHDFNRGVFQAGCGSRRGKATFSPTVIDPKRAPPWKDMPDLFSNGVHFKSRWFSRDRGPLSRFLRRWVFQGPRAYAGACFSLTPSRRESPAFHPAIHRS